MNRTDLKNIFEKYNEVYRKEEKGLSQCSRDMIHVCDISTKNQRGRGATTSSSMLGLQPQREAARARQHRPLPHSRSRPFAQQEWGSSGVGGGLSQEPVWP